MADKTKDEYAVYPVGKHHYRHDKEILELPEGWVYVASGDAALTRRIKSRGEYWAVKGKYKNRETNIGLCAPSAAVDEIRAALESERADPAYARRLESGKKYREAKQNAYEGDFERAVTEFLHFHPRWAELAQKLARAVTAHAVPVGSGTVARTSRIPIEERAEAAVIAWLRHQTTAYDDMYIPRTAGKRREVRRDLAAKSRSVLKKYQTGEDVDLAACPLAAALCCTGGNDEVHHDT